MRAFLLLRLLLLYYHIICRFLQMSSFTRNPLPPRANNQFCGCTSEKSLSHMTPMKWFPFQRDCPTPASDWLPAKYPLEVQGTDQPAGTDCDSRGCGRRLFSLFFFTFLSGGNAAQILWYNLHFSATVVLIHRESAALVRLSETVAVLCTLCIIKYVLSFENGFPMDACDAFV